MAAKSVFDEEEKKPIIQFRPAPNRVVVNRSASGETKPIVQSGSSQNGLMVKAENNPIVQSRLTPISLMVKGMNGNEVFFRVKSGVQLRKLMMAYCENQSVDVNVVRFLYNGRVVRPWHTPDELEMEDGDEILIMMQPMGGGHSGR